MWAKSSGEEPFPIQYQLRPLTDLLDPAYFKDADEAELEIKKNRFVCSESVSRRRV